MRKVLHVVNRFGKVAAVSAAGVGSAMAQTSAAQPDPSQGTAYITAGVATLLLVANVKYVIGAVKWIAGKTMAMFGR